jgi:hypothetical protein
MRSMGFAALYPSYQLLRTRCRRMGRAQRNPSSRSDSTLPETALGSGLRTTLPVICAHCRLRYDPSHSADLVRLRLGRLR